MNEKALPAIGAVSITGDLVVAASLNADIDGKVVHIGAISGHIEFNAPAAVRQKPALGDVEDAWVGVGVGVRVAVEVGVRVRVCVVSPSLFGLPFALSGVFG